MPLMLAVQLNVSRSTLLPSVKLILDLAMSVPVAAASAIAG
jgi:hypothetical protein